VNGHPRADIFDHLADTYDEHFSDRTAGRWLRSMVLGRVMPLLPPAANILEVGCGTGEDAIRFARRGHNVIATDVSSAMLRRSEEKFAALDAESRRRIRTQRLDASKPQESGLQDDGLDLVFSNFGALNCIADTRPLFRFANDRLKPGGHLAIVMMGRFCLWETVGFLLRGDLRRATRRWSGRSEFRAGTTSQAVYYPTVGSIRRSFPSGLALRGTCGIGTLVPGSEFFHWCERWPKFFKRLAGVERRTACGWPMNRLGDHFLIIVQKEQESQ